MFRRVLFGLLPALLAGCTAVTTVVEATPTSTPAPTPATPAAETTLNAACLEAARTALRQEIRLYEGWAKQADDQAKKQHYQQVLEALQQKLQAYEQMAPQDYRPSDTWDLPALAGEHPPLPPQQPIVLPDAWLAAPSNASDGALLTYKGMSRSGPFYIVVGFAPGVRPLRLGRHYHLKVLPLMPQSYPFSAFYVCVLEASPLPTMK